MGELRLEGSEATLRLDGDANLTLRAHGEPRARAIDYAWDDVDFGGDCVHATCRHVADHLLRGAPLENEARDYLVNLAVEDAIYRADAAGTRVRVAPPVSPPRQHEPSLFRSDRDSSRDGTERTKRDDDGARGKLATGANRSGS